MSPSLSLSLAAQFGEGKEGLVSLECPGKAGAGHGARGQWWHVAGPVVAVVELAGASPWSETGDSWLTFHSQLNQWDLNLRMVHPSPRLLALRLVNLKASRGKLRHVNGDSW